MILIHEFGHRWVGYKLKIYFENSLGPEIFGVKVTVGELTFKPWSGAFSIEDLTLCNPPGYEGEYLMKAHHVTSLVAMRKAVFSWGKNTEIGVLQLKHID